MQVMQSGSQVTMHPMHGPLRAKESSARLRAQALRRRGVRGRRRRQGRTRGRCVLPRGLSLGTRCRQRAFLRALGRRRSVANLRQLRLRSIET